MIIKGKKVVIVKASKIFMANYLALCNIFFWYVFTSQINIKMGVGRGHIHEQACLFLCLV